MTQTLGLQSLMPHALEIQYGLTAQELLEAIDRRFRLKVALEGAVAEVHFERKLKVASQEGWMNSYQSHDVDGMHDFTVTSLDDKVLKIEVKTIRNGIKPQVEIQKTRAAKGDPSSRYYDYSHFDVIAVCLGRHTKDWTQFAYAFTKDLPRHRSHPNKLQVMHAIPLNGKSTSVVWYSRLQDLIDAS
ncbi:MAG: hypothetical protein HC765_15715 [Brachymonas sp.]|nr:hypothetical protein [Brachymonas sp.]